MSSVLFVLSVVMMAVVAAILLLGLRNMFKHGSPNRSQTLMRLRVAAQFVAIVIMMGALYFAGK